ncbi:MAG: hypothetical protein KVP17_004196 [Porospora cf. gigantea B]|uniref:uncharacterized protein n=1 Tax=Porospora cf. gigantea B TaxID=2853592 RepID=UPI0035719600|nr:MAG: hypothetical protein KVP17_004196 [Porospora cf. gigantea B]
MRLHLFLLLSRALSLLEARIQTSGALFELIQWSKINTDSKRIVDSVANREPESIQQAFLQRFAPVDRGVLAKLIAQDTSDSGVIDLIERLRAFQTEFFDAPGSEHGTKQLDLSPPWPVFLRDLQPEFQSISQEVHRLWSLLSREMKPDFVPSRSSFLPVPNPFQIPGDRFVEFYYWDTYWVIRGLLRSGLHNVAKDQLDNFVSLVSEHGKVPNGTRTYYLNRSQPPLLIQMAESYLDSTGDKAYIESILPLLLQEYDWWMGNRAIVVNGHVVNVYGSDTMTPRPESHVEDVTAWAKYMCSGQLEEGACVTATITEKVWCVMRGGENCYNDVFFNNIAAICESGWDHSSRWYDLSTFPQLMVPEVDDLVPVDLNTILAANERTLARFLHDVDPQQAAFFEQAFAERVLALESLFWDDEAHHYWDIFTSGRPKRGVQSVANYYPLYFKTYSATTDGQVRDEMLAQSLAQNGFLSQPIAAPATMTKTSREQWDWPNDWPPLNHMLVFGLTSSNSERCRALGNKLAVRWVRNVKSTFEETGFMFEKYDVLKPRTLGTGGEYATQRGFGWTNGALQDMLGGLDIFHVKRQIRRVKG